jgi:hypothetical protein
MTTNKFIKEIEKQDLTTEELELVCDYALFLYIRKRFRSIARFVEIFK